jgi:hypothetical protein
MFKTCSKLSAICSKLRHLPSVWAQIGRRSVQTVQNSMSFEQGDVQNFCGRNLTYPVNYPNQKADFALF